jgi:hypothetical protein
MRRAKQDGAAAAAGRGRLVAALLGAATAALAPAPAWASSANNFWLGPVAGGPVKGTYGPNEVIYFSGTNRFINACRDPLGINDFVYPATDVYVIVGSAQPGDGAILKDAGGSASTVIEIGAAGFQDEILSITVPGGKLGAGTYSVVFDTCQDGKFTVGEDDFFPDAITVELPAVLPPASPVIAQIKQAAYGESQQWQEVADTFHRMLAAADYVKGSACFVGDISACLSLIQTIAADPKVQKYLDYVGKLAKAAQCVVDPSTCIGLINDLLGTPPAINGSPRDIVLGGFKNLLANQTRSYLSVSLDPPRADFAQPTSAQVPWVFEYQPGGSRFLAAVAAADPALERQQALLDAFLTAIERYQGAQQAGKATEALARAEEARSLALALEAALPDVVARMQAIGPALLQDVPGIDAAWALVSADRDAHASLGFSAEELRNLRNMGLTQPQIDATMATLLSHSSSDLYGTSMAGWDALVAGLATRSVSTAAAYRAAADGFGLLAGQIRASSPAAAAAVPTVSVGGPYAGTVGSPLTFTATAPAGVTLEWDLQASGRFTDGTGASVTATYRLPGERVIAVRATSPGTAPVIATGLLSVSDGNSPPVLSSPTPSTMVQWVSSGDPVAFSVTPSDPDGDPVTVTWQLDGVDQATGPAWSHTFTDADLGQHEVQAIGSDGHRGHQVTRDFLVMVRGVDADGDGWSRTPTGDCNDADPDVHPGHPELLLNGKDDDCDPATLDAPPAVAGGSVTGGQVVAWGVYFSTAAAGYGPQAVAGLDNVLQVRADLDKGWALRVDGTVAFFATMTTNCGVSGTGGTTCPAGVTDVLGVGGAPRLTGVMAIDYSDGKALGAALRQDGSVVGWGLNSGGAAGTGSTAPFLDRPEVVLRDSDRLPLTGVSQIKVGVYNGWGIMPNGDVWIWGASGGTQCLGPAAYSAVPTRLAVPAPVIGKAAQISDQAGNTMIRRPDGSVAYCGGGIIPSSSTYLPVAVPGFGPNGQYGRAAQVLVSDNSFWVVTDRGELYGWGQMLGGGFSVFGMPTGATPVPPFADAAGTLILQPALAPLPPGPPVSWITAEGDTFHVVRADGSVLIWGGTTRYANGSFTSATVVPPTAFSLGGLPVQSDASMWSGAAVVIPAGAIAPGWTKPRQWVGVSAGPAAGTLSGPEGSTLGVPLTLSGPVDVAVVVTWSFNGATGTTTVPAGALSAAAPVTLPHDGLDGPDLELEFTIVSVSDGLRIDRPAAEVTVVNVDPPPAVSVTGASVKEGDTTLTDVTVTVSLSQASGFGAVARLSTADGTALAGLDYRAADLAIPFAAGETSKVIHLSVLGNTVPQPDRQFTVAVTGLTHLAPAGASATVTILDDDPVQLTLTSTSVLAGGTAVVAVAAPGLPAGETVSLGWATADGSARAGTDYLAGAGAVTLASGQAALISVATLASAGAGVTVPGVSQLQFLVRATPVQGRRVVLQPAPARVLLTGLAIVTADTTPPVVTGTPDRAPNAAGWYGAPVTITWTAIDAVDGVLAPPPPTVVSAEGNGSGAPILSAPACDRSGNCAQGSFGPLKLDRTPPTLAITGVVSGSTYAPGAVPVAGCTASDALSGLAGPCLTVVTSAAGTFTVTATAGDLAGNTATVTATYRVSGCLDDDDEEDGARGRERSDRRHGPRGAHHPRGGDCEDEDLRVERERDRD